MTIYSVNKNEIRISSDSGIIAFIPSGSKTDPTTAISASIPQILAITCSSNFNNRLTKLTTLNAFGIITLNSGSISAEDDRRLILRYIDSSSRGIIETIDDTGLENDGAGSITKDLKFSNSLPNDVFINIPLNNNDDSFLVAYRTIEALNNSPIFNSSFKAAIVDDGSNLTSITASIGNMTIGSGFKIRNSASLGTNSLTDGGEGKFTITSINSSSVALPDFSGTQVQVGGMMIGSSFKIGGSPDTFKYNIIQSGSGAKNQPFFEGIVPEVSSSLIQRIDPDDKKSFEFLAPSQSVGGDEDLIAFYISSSRRIGFATKDPLTDIDIRADEFQIQRKTERRGIRLNPEGNVESFDRNTDTATTGSEFILKYSRGISITKEFVNKIFIRTFTNDSDAQTFFNALKPDIQQSGLKKGEELGFISPAQIGDTLGQIRWVSESGSIGDFNERISGEAAAIKAVVSDGASDGISADLIFSVANKSGTSQQKLLLDSNDAHQLTGSLNVFGSVAIEGFLQSQDNPNTKIDFDAGTDDVNIELQPNGNNMMVLSNGGTVPGHTGQYGVLINSSHANADFRIDGDSSTNGDFSLFFDASGDNGRGQLYLGGEFLADFQGISPAVNAKLHVSGNILVDGANGHITASGNISSSGFISASSFSGDGSGLTNVTATATVPTGTISGSDHIFTAITSSGNISASGIITALSSNIVTIDGGSF